MTAAEILRALDERGWTLAVAESLTGGLLADAFVQVPGASTVLVGGVVAYATDLKRSLLGVDAGLLDAHGPVHPEVACEMAEGVRRRLALAGRRADVGLATTGVAGPAEQDGHPAGTVYIGISLGEDTRAVGAMLHGDRAAIRQAAVRLALAELGRSLTEE